MPLHPQVRAMLDEAAALNEPPPYLMNVPEMRQWHHNNLIVDASELAPMFRVEDHTIRLPAAQLPARVYWPSDAQGLPILYFVHGGGWVLGDLDSYDYMCRQIAEQAQCITVSVGYRRAPEHKFPGPLWDVYTTAQWVIDNASRLGGDPTRIAIGGDSAGGNLSAATALLARDRGGPQFVCQALLYPVTDFCLPGTESYQAYATGYGLDRDFMIWFWNRYAPEDVDLNNPYLNPLRAEDLSGLPPAFVMTAQYDPLHDEGQAYAKRLEAAGVEVTYVDYQGMIHGFLDKPQFDVGKQALKDIGGYLSTAFSRSG